MFCENVKHFWIIKNVPVFLDKLCKIFEQITKIVLKILKVIKIILKVLVNFLVKFFLKINENLNFLLLSKLIAGLGMGCCSSYANFPGFWGGDIPSVPPPRDAPAVFSTGLVHCCCLRKSQQLLIKLKLSSKVRVSIKIEKNTEY